MQAEGIAPTDDSMYSVEAVQQRIDLQLDHYGKTDVEEWLPLAQCCRDAPPAWSVPIPLFVPADAEVRPRRRW